MAKPNFISQLKHHMITSRLEINWKRKNSIEYLVMLKQKQSCLKLNNLGDMYTKIQIQATN